MSPASRGRETLARSRAERGETGAKARDFRYDFHVSFTADTLSCGGADYNSAPFGGGGRDVPGISDPARDAASGVFHTYDRYGRWVRLPPAGRRSSHFGRAERTWVF